MKRGEVSEPIEFMPYPLQEEAKSNIQVDFKPFHTWTSEDKKEYNARVLRRHRRKAKLQKIAAVEKVTKAKLKLEILRVKSVSLQREYTNLIPLIEKHRNTWSASYLRTQNDRLRKEVQFEREKAVFREKIVHLVDICPKENIDRLFKFIYERNLKLIDAFSDFKQRNYLEIDEKRIHLEMNVRSFHTIVKKEIEIRRNLPIKLRRLAYDRKKKSFFLLNLFVECKSSTKILELAWNVFCEKQLQENNFDRIINLAEFNLDEFKFINQWWKYKKVDSEQRIKFVSCIDSKKGKQYVFVYVLTKIKKRNFICSLKYEINEFGLNLYKRKEEYIILFEKLSLKSKRIKININYIHNRIELLIPKIISGLEFLIGGQK
eukprot:snap_masked-scaffold_5-processed-gene-5.50-mRNA-1 protein AED:1.00 eAED:1.00 QI:0/-1/0/0/-1/1/1/0/374